MYQALYRKWRPKTFDDVVGQPHITETLKTQVRTGRTSHAYLFIGTRGTGKTSCAKILAKAVNCEHPVDGNPCNACRVCRGIDDGSILDVVEMDAASNNGVDNVRQLRDEAIFSPATARKRVYIIDEVHMLSLSAFNALLKILEEPPEHLMFILATTELSKVPATILSRCQRHSFRRLDTESIIARLQFVAGQEHIDLSPEAAKLLAVRSEGGMRDALSMLDQCAGRERIDAETVFSALGLAGSREIAALLDSIAAQDSGGAIERFERLWQDGKDPSTLLGELSALLRDVLLDAVAPKNGRALRSGSFDDEILDAFRGRFPAEALIDQIECVHAALGDMRSGQAKTRCELCLIALCSPGARDSLPALRARVAALEQAFQTGLPAASPAPAATPAPVGRDDPGAPLSAEPASQTDPAAPLWPRVSARLREKFPPGTAMLLSDPLQIGVTERGDTLLLAMRNDFAATMADRPDVLSTLSALASDTAGRPIRVQTGAPDISANQRSAEELDRKLDDLRKFDIVKFKEE
jgi:DNA polymerase-3 subunit gamma/tau